MEGAAQVPMWGSSRHWVMGTSSPGWGLGPKELSQGWQHSL